VAHLAGTRRSEADIGHHARKVGNRAGELQHRGRPTGADIEHLRARRAPVDPAHECLHHVRDVDEVPCLRAVAEDLDRRATGKPVAEDGNDAGIGRARVLPRAVHVEEPEPGRGNAVNMGTDRGVQLAAELVGAVRGQRPRGGALGKRQVLTIPVNRRRRGIDQRNRAGADRVHQYDGTGEIDPVGAAPVPHAALHRGDGGEVAAGIHTLQRPRDGVRIGDVALDQIHLCGKVRSVAGGKVIQNADPPPVTQQRVAKVRADEAGAARDQDCFHPSSSSIAGQSRPER
jgi:hypothetical protein